MCKYDVNDIIPRTVCVVHIISKLNSLKNLHLISIGLESSWVV